jgi:DNA polymerase III delta subunit
MPIYFYWGEDDFTLNQAVHHLRDRVLNLPLVSFSLKNKKLSIWIFFVRFIFAEFTFKTSRKRDRRY